MHKIDGIVLASQQSVNVGNLLLRHGYMIDGVKQAACKHLQAACLRVMARAMLSLCAISV